MTHPTDALRLVPLKATPQQLETAAFNLSAEIGAEEAMKLGPHIELAYELLVAAAPASPLPEGGGWQDISTAPKDGTWIVGFVPGPQPEVTPICWESGQDDFGKNGWCGAGSGYGGVLYEVHNVLDAQPTHWMPLPAAPTGDA